MSFILDLVGLMIWRPNRYDDWGCNRLEIYVLIYYYCECDSGVLMMVYLPSTSELNQVQRQWGSTSNKQPIHLKF